MPECPVWLLLNRSAQPSVVVLNFAPTCPLRICIHHILRMTAEPTWFGLP
jgi:hypothetical protein